MKGRSGYSKMCFLYLQETNETTEIERWLIILSSCYSTTRTQIVVSEAFPCLYFMCVMALTLPGKISRLAFCCLCKIILRLS